MRIITWVVLAVACLAMFDVPAAYAVSRGAPWWLALAIGLAMFPIAPLVWHLVGERKRARANKPARPGATSKWERLGLRAAAIGILAIGGLILVSRDKLVDAMRHDALWFIPTSESTRADSPALDLVPPDAETLVWFRPTDDARTTLARFSELAAAVPALRSDPPELVAGGSPDGWFAIERGSGDVLAQISRSVNEFAARFRSNTPKLTPISGFLFDFLLDAPVTDAGHGLHWMASKGVKSAIGAGRPSKLLELVTRAPDDAFLVSAGRADDEDRGDDRPRTMLGYLHLRAGRLELVVEVEAADAATADRLLANTRRVVEESDMRLIVDCWSKVGGDSSVTRDGATIRARASIEPGEIRTLLKCRDEALKSPDHVDLSPL
jgi:hypothetical protein